jgi:hypothetical protein
MDVDERKLADRCQADADINRPAFSEALHGRIMTAVRAEKHELPAPSCRESRRVVRVAAAIAASLLVVAALAWQIASRTETAPAVQQVATVAAPQSPTAIAPAPATALVQDYSLDDLNRGAGLAMKLVIDRLPIDVPTEDWGLPNPE